jgi:hypothetical protein
VTDPSLRAGDADRDAVTERLRVAHAEGRLTAEELDERLDAALSARTMGELEPLTRDLPPVPGSGAVARRPRTGDEALPARRPGHHSGMRAAWGTWLTAVLVCVAIWAATSVSNGDLESFWPIWVAGPWGAVLLAGTLSGRWNRR